jgi:hypothetical protein
MEMIMYKRFAHTIVVMTMLRKLISGNIYFDYDICGGVCVALI